MPKYQMLFDTLEGEVSYKADISEHEALSEVLRDILADLKARGHVLRGLATGELKVVAAGRELNLSRTLPQQRVQPNDVLRVLVESYTGGAITVRADRIRAEWALLQRLATLNRQYLSVIDQRASPARDVFRVRLHHSPALVTASGTQLTPRGDHTIRLEFPRRYPDVPIECYVEERVFHPNVRTETGFMCLWEAATTRDSCVQALARAQATMAYRMINLGGAHVMNPEAGTWYTEFGKPRKLVPLSWAELQVFDVQDGRAVWLDPDRRFGRGLRLGFAGRLA